MVTAGISLFRENSNGWAGNRTRDLMISSQRLWPVDHDAGLLGSISETGLLCLMLLNVLRVLIKGLYCDTFRLWGSLAWRGLLMCVSSCRCDMVHCTFRLLVHCFQVGNIILWFILRSLNQLTLYMSQPSTVIIYGLWSLHMRGVSCLEHAPAD